METYVLEENDLGEAAIAYEQYPGLCKAYQSQLAQYQKTVNELRARSPLSLRREEMRRVDALAAELEKTLMSCQGLRTTLNDKINSLIGEAATLQDELAALDGRLAVDKAAYAAAEGARASALALCNQGDYSEALRAAMEARDSFSMLLAAAAQKWLTEHLDLAEQLSMEEIRA